MLTPGDRYASSWHIYQSMLIHYNLEGEVIDIESANDKDNLRLKRSYFLLEDKIVF